MRGVRCILLLSVLGTLISCKGDQDASLDPLLDLIQGVEDSTFQHVLNNPDKFQYQIRYTQVDRDKNNGAILTSYEYNVDPKRYFYPASTVKMPVAFLALQRINELHQENKHIDRYSRLAFGAEFPPQEPMAVDSSAPSGYPRGVGELTETATWKHGTTWYFRLW